MSQQPVWISDAESLGTIPEGRYYKVELRAYDPDFPNDPTQVTYTLIAGKLPAGIAILRTGSLEGIPVSIADAVGVPSEVSSTLSYKFVIRATTNNNRINDRTFTLTITGQDAPEWITPAGTIGAFFDGTSVNFQFEYTDPDPNDIVTVEMIGGSLPDGLTLSDTGLLTGHIIPTLTPDSIYSGFSADNKEFGEYPYGFDQTSLDINNQFILQISDGKNVDIRTFELLVLSRDSLTADTTDFTADITSISADLVASEAPYLTNYNPNIGKIKHDNFWAYQLKGEDPTPNNPPVKYVLSSGSLPQGVSLDENTGWISGYLPNIQLTEIDYNFSVKVKTGTVTPIFSEEYNFTMTLVGEIDSDITWVTPHDLGSINNGEISTLFIKAIHSGTILSYRFKPGVFSKLPQGLQLSSSGNIIGRTSFETYSLDNNATTFDADFETRLDPNAKETTFDRTFIFTVEAYSSDNSIIVTKDFVLHLNRLYDLPYKILYANALPPAQDRKIIKDLLTNNDIITQESLYRNEDPFFGVAKSVSYQHAFGLNPASLEEYYASFDKNHFNKTVTLGEIKTARALADDGVTVLYEVVYSEIQDKQVNPNGQSVSKEITLSEAINHGAGGIHSTTTQVLYPNSFENMRSQVVDQIGQVSRVLPRWMLSKQKNGNILGFTPAWVIAYTKPNNSSQLAFRIKNQFKEKLNKVDFTIDRFILDNRMARNWDSTNQGWIETVITTFDEIDNIDNVTADTTLVTADSNRYINFQGISGTTTFDENSTRFLSPVDTFENITTDKFDQYVLFPQVEIIKVYDSDPVV